MAASNESQGLKIAVAIFVMLTVILAVSTYFSYRFYDETAARLAKADSDARAKEKSNSDLLSANEALRKEIGVKAEELDGIKNEIKNEYKKIDEEVKSLIDQTTAAVAKAQESGATGPELEEAKARVAQIAAAYRGELNKNYISALSRSTELLRNLGVLANQLALNYTEVKRSLEGTNGVNAQQIAVTQKALTDAKNDLAAEQQKHVEERQSLLTKVDQFQTERANLETQVANLTTRLRQLEEDSSKKLALSQQTVREYRDRVERKETVLDRPDGIVTYVDYNRGEVHTNVVTSQGARPQMQFAIFDSHSPGLPTDKPKGTIELVQVSDRNSIARITKTFENINPIRVGDYVYSAAWSPNEPMRFALIGKIDVNRDGKDDRDDLRRMIEQAGGIVDYDLPPPDAGKETGKLTGRDSWYVIDERMPFVTGGGEKTNVTANENADFLKKQTDAVREARLNGVRPMPIERLLPYLGYDYHAPIQGRAEAVDLSNLKRVLMPRANQANPPVAPANPPGAEPKEETPEPKSEEPK
ncbi:MAG: hypothetical protein U0794_05120 [Isosphaeraceae bacterium]